MIKVKAEAPYKLDCPKVQFRVEVDGDWIREPIMTKDYCKDKAWEDVIEGPCGDVNSSHRPMAFSAIRTSKSTPFLPKTESMANNELPSFG